LLARKATAAAMSSGDPTFFLPITSPPIAHWDCSRASAADRPRAQLEFTPAALDVLASPLAAHKDEIMRPSPSLDQLLARFS
jgi:hypothetical protein